MALMSGKNCYGVQCFSEELCTAVPAKKAPSSLMISHVTITGEEGKRAVTECLWHTVYFHYGRLVEDVFVVWDRVFL